MKPSLEFFSDCPLGLRPLGQSDYPWNLLRANFSRQACGFSTVYTRLAGVYIQRSVVGDVCSEQCAVSSVQCAVCTHLHTIALNIEQHNTSQNCTELNSHLQHCTNSTEQSFTVTVPHSALSSTHVHYTSLHCTDQNCTVLNGTTLH